MREPKNRYFSHFLWDFFLLLLIATKKEKTIYIYNTTPHAKEDLMFS
jgi:hypothetical protein